jgi:hypothetical protein
MRVLTFFFLFCLVWISCKPGGSAEGATGDKPQTEVEALESQVMAIHDEVMPKMSDINHLSGELRKYKAGLKENEVGKLESPDGLDQVIESLKMAEQGMWDWMKSFGDTKATLTDDQLKSFYEKELEKVTRVKSDMLTSIEKAQAWLAAHPTK